MAREIVHYHHLGATSPTIFRGLWPLARWLSIQTIWQFWTPQFILCMRNQAIPDRLFKLHWNLRWNNESTIQHSLDWNFALNSLKYRISKSTILVTYKAIILILTTILSCRLLKVFWKNTHKEIKAAFELFIFIFLIVQKRTSNYLYFASFS